MLHQKYVLVIQFLNISFSPQIVVNEKYNLKIERVGFNVISVFVVVFFVIPIFQKYFDREINFNAPFRFIFARRFELAFIVHYIYII